MCTDAAGRRHAASLLTLALRAADGVAFKFGYLDFSARLIDLTRSAARLAEHPLLLAEVAYVRTETSFANGDLEAAARTLELAADQVPDLAPLRRRPHSAPCTCALFGRKAAGWR